MVGVRDVEPRILVPYPGPDGSGDVQDIFVYLRPETNGVVVESAVLGAVRSFPGSGTNIHLIYLANIPGQFIVDHHIVERHYANKLYFAVHGKRAFTNKMRDAFEAKFLVSWAETRIVGSFEALRLFRCSPEKLFSRWVAAEDIVLIEGQTVKRFGDIYVVNYDIPALLHKNTRNTDIAVMLFRCRGEDGYFDDVVEAMRAALIDRNMLGVDVPSTRAFHYSKGPFEQLLDARDYLYRPDGTTVDLSELSFAAFAASRGFTAGDLRGIMENPICLFEEPDGRCVEENLFAYTLNDTYEDAVKKAGTIRSQLWTHRF
ncbi:MAG: hypothetical protein E4H09_01915 [Spirochaetales bacterium]|nr:MAG: hypothetical protein E4H09_01915 [Spirochaetales bacterium]